MPLIKKLCESTSSLHLVPFAIGHNSLSLMEMGNKSQAQRAGWSQMFLVTSWVKQNRPSHNDSKGQRLKSSKLKVHLYM